MNDHHLDPHDQPEPPECCGEEMDILDDGSCICIVCGCSVAHQDYPDPPDDKGDWERDQMLDQDLAGQELCPHGNEWHECDACDHASDIAYDTARERR